MKNLANGVIETTDGRYIRILEIEPINFMLRSDEEQFNIISSFASWLKISPMRMQFKSMTRKADSDRHVAMVRAELEAEENESCKRLGEGYIRLIKDVGSREALTRRFFLIFQYEELRRGDGEDYGQVLSMMQAAEQTARAYFFQCGNSILDPKDPDEATAEILYMFFNRRSCVDEPFQSRVNRVVIDTMATKQKVIGIDPVPHIRISNFLAPRGIDLNHHHYVVMDGLYYTFLYIKGNGYPSMVRAGWMSSLINAGEGVDVDVFLRRENRSKSIDKVAQRIRLNRTKLKSMQDTSSDYEELANSIQSGYYIKHGLSNNEDLFYLSIFVTVSAKSYEELMWRKQQMVDMLKSMDMYVSDCRFQQEAAFRSVMPFVKMAPSLETKSQRNVLTSGAASTYMFTSFEMSDDTGVLLGINRHNNSLCIVDLFNTKKNKNANLNLLGTSGAGKTFTMQLLALRMRMRGIQCFILAPIKGHEFRRACKKIGGEFIKIAPGSPHCINIMEIRHTISPEMELIDEIDYSEMDSMLARKIQQLMTFFSLLIPDMTNEEEQMLDEALIRTYAKFGITHDNDSLYIDRITNPPRMKATTDEGEFNEETAVLTTTSAEDGSFHFENIPKGIWYIREIRQPEGYVLCADIFPIEISENEQIVEIEIVNERIRATLSLTKIDEEYPDHKLSGAEFEVYRDVNGNKELDKEDTLLGLMEEMEAGFYEMKDVEFGGVLVREKTAPEGFYLDENVYYVSIESDGETYTVENKAGVGFINQAHRGNLKIIKTSSDGKLEGFTFRISGEDYDRTFTTGSDGIIFIENLRVGKYTVTELDDEMSEGYRRPDPVTVELVTDETLTVNVHNEKVTVDVPKTGDDSNLWIWGSLLGLSALGAGALVFVDYKRRKRIVKK